MSKKPRRLRTPNLPPEAFVTPPAARPESTGTEAAAPRAPETATGAARPAATGHSHEPPVRAVNWQREYGAVLSDLKRTGILAGALLAIMIALSIVIR